MNEKTKKHSESQDESVSLEAVDMSEEIPDERFEEAIAEVLTGPEFNKLSDRQRTKAGRKLTSTFVRVSMTSHSGPLPPVSEFAGYEDVVTGAAKEILEMSKEEQSFRHQIFLKTQSSDNAYRFFGMGSGVFIVAGFIALAVFGAIIENNFVVVGALSVSALGTIQKFVDGRAEKNGD